MQNLGTLLPLDKFWTWLQEHHSCIVRGGTEETWLYDQDDLHWHLFEERGGKRGVQLMRGKQVLGELSISSSEVVYVEMSPSAETQGYFEFQLLGGPEKELRPLYHFVIAHGYEEAEQHRLATH